jgi:hypothetical protein
MDDLPSPVRHIVERWTHEFNRVDMMERFASKNQGNQGNQVLMARLREELHAKPPYYRFTILTQAGARLRITLMLPDCDPSRVRTDQRIPEAHIVFSERIIRYSEYEILAASVSGNG